jgi:hypothetical protein
MMKSSWVMSQQPSKLARTLTSKEITTLQQAN